MGQQELLIQVAIWFLLLLAIYGVITVLVSEVESVYHYRTYTVGGEK